MITSYTSYIPSRGH